MPQRKPDLSELLRNIIAGLTANNEKSAYKLSFPEGAEPTVRQDEVKGLIIDFPDGTVIESDDLGGRLTFSEKSVGIDLSSIRSVGIDDLRDVEEHCINRAYNTISHFVRFTGGGELRFAFSLTGELLELSGHRVNWSIEPGGIVRLGAWHV